VIDFARVIVELPNGKVKEFRPGEGSLQIVNTAPSGTPANAAPTIHYIQFTATIEEGEL
jgi:hypothetical protein